MYKGEDRLRVDLIEELVERNKKGLADIYGRSYKKVCINSPKSVL
jgi:hypothetical protein